MDKQCAIVHGIRVPALDCIAVCEVWTYDVWGSAREGYEVNDRSCMGRAIKIPARATISNVPRRPGAEDEYRSFKEDSASADGGLDINGQPMMFVSWELTMKDIRKACGWTAGVTVDHGSSDDMHIELVYGAHERPIGQVLIVGWADKD